MRRQLTLAMLLTMALGVTVPLERPASAQEVSNQTKILIVNKRLFIEIYILMSMQFIPEIFGE